MVVWSRLVCGSLEGLFGAMPDVYTGFLAYTLSVTRSEASPRQAKAAGLDSFLQRSISSESCFPHVSEK